MERIYKLPVSQKPALSGVFRQHFRVVTAMLQREMTTRYGRSFGGYMWAIAQPIATLLILTLVWQVVMRTPALGQSFLVFFASGVMPFRLFASISSRLGNAISVNRNLIRFPPVTAYDAIISRAVLEFISELVIGLLVLSAAIIATGESVSINVPMLLASIFAGFALGFGVGVFNAVVGMLYPSWKTLYAILTAPLFLISAVLFIPEAFPPHIQHYMQFNPLVHVVCSFREAFYPAYNPLIKNLFYPVLVGIFFCFLGLSLLARNKHRLAEQ